MIEHKKLPMRNFRDFSVYSNSMKLVKSIYKITISWPDTERYGLISQVNRAAISIPSNIAEGSSRKSEKEFSRFLEIALGSAFELETQLILSKEINYLSEFRFDEIIADLMIIQKQLNSFITTLKKP